MTIQESGDPRILYVRNRQALEALANGIIESERFKALIGAWLKASRCDRAKFANSVGLVRSPGEYYQRGWTRQGAGVPASVVAFIVGVHYLLYYAGLIN